MLGLDLNLPGFERAPGLDAEVIQMHLLSPDYRCVVRIARSEGRPGLSLGVSGGFAMGGGLGGAWGGGVGRSVCLCVCVCVHIRRGIDCCRGDSLSLPPLGGFFCSRKPHKNPAQSPSSLPPLRANTSFGVTHAFSDMCALLDILVCLIRAKPQRVQPLQHRRGGGGRLWLRATFFRVAKLVSRTRHFLPTFLSIPIKYFCLLSQISEGFARFF